MEAQQNNRKCSRIPTFKRSTKTSGACNLTYIPGMRHCWWTSNQAASSRTLEVGSWCCNICLKRSRNAISVRFNLMGWRVGESLRCSAITNNELHLRAAARVPLSLFPSFPPYVPLTRIRSSTAILCDDLESIMRPFLDGCGMDDFSFDQATQGQCDAVTSRAEGYTDEGQPVAEVS